MVYFVSFFIIVVLFIGRPNINSDVFSQPMEVEKKSLIDNKSRSKFILFFIAFVWLSLIGALRYNVGTDYLVYSRLQIPEVLSGNLTLIEPLSTLVFLIGGKIGGNQLVFALIHFLIIGFVTKAIYDQSVDYSFSFFLFFSLGFFNMSLNLMRQAIAIAIFIYAIKFIYEKKALKYYLWIFVAIMFHKTAIIYLPIYFFKDIIFSIKKLIIFIFVFTITSFCFDDVLYYITTKLDIYRNYWGTNEMAIRINHNYSLTYWTVNLFTFITMIILYKMGTKAQIKGIKKLSLYIYIQFICLLIMYASLVTYIPNFDRLLTMFSYVQIISLPYFFSLKVNKIVKTVLFFCTVVIMMIGFYQLIIVQNIGETLPYQTIFN